MNNVNPTPASSALKVLPLALILFVSSIGCYFFVTNKTHVEPTVTRVSHKVADVLLPHESAFATTTIEAKSAIVYDIKTGKVLFEKNADAQLPLASLTKVMTALSAVDQVPENTLVTVDEESLKEEGDSGLKSDEKWRLKNLLDFALVVSSNDAMKAVASIIGSIKSPRPYETNGEEEFVKTMNAYSKRIGLKQTYFINSSGLDVSPVMSGAYGSARDMSKLFTYALQTSPSLLEATQYSELPVSSETAIYSAKNTDAIVNSIPYVLASKTGYTDLSDGNLVIAFNAGIDRPVVIAVLGSSYEGRFADVQALLGSTLKEIPFQ